MAETIHGPLVQDQITLNVWHELVKDVPFEVGKQNIMHHLRSSSYKPKPNDIIGDYFDPSGTSVYDIQEKERQEIMNTILLEDGQAEYVPMPDNIHALIDKISDGMSVSRFKVIDDDD